MKKTMQNEINEINEKIHAAKFVPDLKRVVAELAAAVYARLIRLEHVALEHAKLLDPKAFHEEPIDVEFEVVPAEAATNAPSDELTRESGDRSQEDETQHAPIKLKRKKDAPPPPGS